MLNVQNNEVSPQYQISFGVRDEERQAHISHLQIGLNPDNVYECTFNKKSTSKSQEENLLTIPDEGIDLNYNQGLGVSQNIEKILIKNQEVHENSNVSRKQLLFQGSRDAQEQSMELSGLKIHETIQFLPLMNVSLLQKQYINQEVHNNQQRRKLLSPQSFGKTSGPLPNHETEKLCKNHIKIAPFDYEEEIQMREQTNPVLHWIEQKYTYEISVMDGLGQGNTCRPEEEDENSQSQVKSQSRQRKEFVGIDQIIIEMDDSKQSSGSLKNTYQNDFDIEANKLMVFKSAVDNEKQTIQEDDSKNYSHYSSSQYPRNNDFERFSSNKLEKNIAQVISPIPFQESSDIQKRYQQKNQQTSQESLLRFLKQGETEEIKDFNPRKNKISQTQLFNGQQYIDNSSINNCQISKQQYKSDNNYQPQIQQNFTIGTSIVGEQNQEYQLSKQNKSTKQNVVSKIKMAAGGGTSHSNVSLREIDSSYQTLLHSSDSISPNKMIYVYSKEEMQSQNVPSSNKNSDPKHRHQLSNNNNNANQALAKMENIIKFESDDYHDKANDGAAGVPYGEGEACTQFNFNSLSSNKKGEDDIMIQLPNLDETLKDQINGEQQDPTQTDKSQHGPFQNFDEDTLFIFSRSSKIRLLCYTILKSRSFERVILISLIINCVALAFYDYDEQANQTSVIRIRNKVVNYINIGVNIIYISEAAMRSIIQGFIIHKRSFMRRHWTFIDLIVISSGIAEIFVDASSNQGLRILRVITRPLKSMNYMQSIKTLVNSLIGSLPAFANLAVFIIFIFILFATLGLQQFNGDTYNQCRLTEKPDLENLIWLADPTIKRPCSKEQTSFVCPSNLTCGNIQDYPQIPFKSEQIYDKAYLNFGVTNFEHLGGSILTVFQMITCETWYYQIMILMDVDTPLLGFIYCFMVIIIGQFFLLNLILAVIVQAFIKQHEKELEEQIRRLEDFNIWSQEDDDEREKSRNDSFKTDESMEDDGDNQEVEESMNLENEIHLKKTLTYDTPSMKSSNKNIQQLLSIRDYKKSVKQGGINQKKKFSQKSLVPKFLQNKDDDEIGTKSEDQFRNDYSPTMQLLNQQKTARNAQLKLQETKLILLGQITLKQSQMHRTSTSDFNSTKKHKNHRKSIQSSKKLISPAVGLHHTKKQNTEDSARLNDKQEIEEERKYINNEDFTKFLRTQAKKRGIVNQLQEESRKSLATSKKDLGCFSDFVEASPLSSLGSVAPAHLRKLNNYFFDKLNKQTQILNDTNSKPHLAPAVKKSNILQPPMNEIIEDPFLEENKSSTNCINNKKSKNIGGFIKVQMSGTYFPVSFGGGGNLQEVFEGGNNSRKRINEPNQRSSLGVDQYLNNQNSSQMVRKNNIMQQVKQTRQKKKSSKIGFGSGIQRASMAKESVSVSSCEELEDIMSVSNSDSSSSSKKNKIVPPTPFFDQIPRADSSNSNLPPIKTQSKREQKLEEKDQKFGGSGVPDDLVNEERTLNELVRLKKRMDIQRQITVMKKQELMMLQEAEKRTAKSRLLRFALALSQSAFYQNIMGSIILINIVILVLDRDNSTIYELNIYEILNIIFTLTYTLQLVLMITTHGLKTFMRGSKMNHYDLIIVGMSIVDVFISNIFLKREDLFDSIIITVIKGSRILRIFKIAKLWESFNVLLDTLRQTLFNISPFARLMLIVLFIYTMLGLELFSNKAKFDSSNRVDLMNGVSPMFNFDNFLHSMLTVYIVLTNDGQSTIYYNYYRAVGSTPATIFWVTFVVFTQKILLNVLQAIVLEKFEEGHARQNIIKEIEVDEINDEKGHKKSGFMRKLLHKTEKLWIKFLKKLKKGDLQKSGKDSNSALASSISRKKSLFLINEDNSLRLKMKLVLEHPLFEMFIVAVIILSSVQLALDTPILDPHSYEKKVLEYIDIATIAVFSLECAVKILTYGFLINGHESYLRNIWNILDFCILIFSYLCLTSLVDTFKFVKTFRILRSLRIISRNEGLKVAVRALLYATPNIFSIAIIMILFFMIFGVILISYFKGKMNYCSSEIQTKEQLITKWDCLNSGGIWRSRTFNFDNIANALITLFTMSTTAGWGEMMIFTITSVDQDYEPHLNERNPFWIIFFMIFMIVGFFFFLNLFVAVVINTFKTEQDRVGGYDLLSEKQKEWIDLKMLILRAGPIFKYRPPSGSKFRMFFYKIQGHKNFDRLIQASIILNTLNLMFKWYRQPLLVTNITEVINQIFTIFFLIEIAIRITGVGFRSYFRDSWNIFDVVIALGSLGSMILYQEHKIKIKFLSFIKSFKILRLIRLLKRGGRTIALVFNTFVITIQHLANIGGLLFLFMYIYSIIGMIYFGEVKRNGSMNDYINFENFTSAFITVFSVATLDSWNYTTESFTHGLRPDNQCIDSPTYEHYKENGYQTVGCSNRTSAFTFFISYMFTVSLVFLKLLIAIILEQYNRTQNQDLRLFNEELTNRFREAWADFDPDATTFIKLADLRPFLFALGAPIGFDDTFHESKYRQDKFIASLDLPVYDGMSKYQFLDVLEALSFRVMIQDHIQKIQDAHTYIEQQTMAAALKKQYSGMSKITGDPSKQPTPKANQGEQQQLVIDQNQVKLKLEREVNRLILQKQSENIVAFKELQEKELRRQKSRVSHKDHTGFTSQHHMALEAAVRRIREQLDKRRQAKQLQILKNKFRQMILQKVDEIKKVTPASPKQQPVASNHAQIDTGQTTKELVFNSQMSQVLSVPKHSAADIHKNQANEPPIVAVTCLNSGIQTNEIDSLPSNLIRSSKKDSRRKNSGQEFLSILIEKTREL